MNDEPEIHPPQDPDANEDEQALVSDTTEHGSFEQSAVPALHEVFEGPFSEENTSGKATETPNPHPLTPNPYSLFPDSHFWSQPEIVPIERIPNLLHLAIVGALVFVSLLCVSLLTRSALYFHFLGVSTVQQATGDIRYTLASQAALYLLTLLWCLLLFPLVWKRSLFAGLQWNGSTAQYLHRRLFGAAFLCFVLALVNGMLLPGPDDTPIDKIFRTPGAAWLLFGFGVTFAPFFEEILFRGFLLPTLCTAFDWFSERSNGRPAPQPYENGHPRWSVSAMAVGSVLTSIPFALMHAEQTGYAIGPFLLLISVSLVLCGTRLFTRSLAASVTVHACYNLMLFSLMLLGTGGFRHLDKM